MSVMTRGIFVLVMILGLCAHAQDSSVRITSSGANADTRTPIAVPPFATADPALKEIASELAEVLAYDLEFSGLFNLLPASQYPPDFQGLDADVSKLDLNSWRGTKAENLVYGLIMADGEDLVAQFRLFDLFSKEQLVGQELRVKRTFPRLAAHRFSEEVVRFIDGTPGVGTTEICFSVGETGNKEIYVSDYDGANIKQVTKHNSISIKPKFSPDGNRIAYLSYKDRYMFIYVYDRATGKSVPVSKEVGLNSAPTWSPDGNTLALTLSKDGNTEIYLRNADGTNPRRLTNNRFGDTSPTFSPDGSRIAYVSEQGGNPQIYVMGADGSGTKRLSFQGGSAYDPVWSPDGAMIAYIAEKPGDGLELYVMNADGTNPRRLTDTQGSNESPSWSPDSRNVVIMSTRDGSAHVYMVNVENPLTQRRVPNLNMRCEGPFWGPRRR
ncbi:MAG: Tol-Pal system beta propeller repeat protein TolB [Candidatus Hydrogenedentes bacterium]|nr:Tol-Pal system beta propeller repeat protein TolB [Candidatus Hydrogenedentota bacterium]